MEATTKWTPESVGYLTTAERAMVKHHNRMGLAVVSQSGGLWGWVLYDDEGRAVAGRRAYSLSAPDACAEADAALDNITNT